MIRLGPGGTSGLGYEEGIEEIKRRGLTALECEFTYGVSMTNSKADIVGSLAKKNGIALSVHAPYYINLASAEKPKVHASITRILQSCERAHHLGATHVVFHAGFYQGKPKEDVYKEIKKRVQEIEDTIRKKEWEVILAPETTGKASQFGDIDELLRLIDDVGCGICVDFSHLIARSNGAFSYEDAAGKIKGIKHIHSHFSGIEYTAKGERRHLMTPEEEIRKLLKQVLRIKADITIINESPDPIGDSEKTKKILSSIQSSGV